MNDGNIRIGLQAYIAQRGHDVFADLIELAQAQAPTHEEKRQQGLEQEGRDIATINGMHRAEMDRNAARQAFLEALPCADGCGFVVALYRKRESAKRPLGLLYKTRCRRWSCPRCRAVNLESWYRRTADIFARHAELYAITVPADRVKATRLTIRYVGTKANIRRGEYRTVLLSTGSTRFYTDRKLESFATLAPPEATSKFMEDLRLIGLSPKRPINGSVAWKLPKRDPSGEFRSIANCGVCSLDGGADMLARLPGTQVKAIPAMDGQSAYLFQIGTNSLSHVADCLATGELLPETIGEVGFSVDQAVFFESFWPS